MEGLFGLESYLKNINGYLADDKVHIVGIWGVGGVGKTTLLRTINNELLPGGSLSQRNSFDHVLFVEASRDYRPEKLQDSISKELGLNLRGVPNLDGRAAAIKKFLESRKFLLLLDDLWQSVDLEKIGILPHKPKHKVIFTTRPQKVCHDMLANQEIKMECLHPTDACLLFEHNINQEGTSVAAIQQHKEKVVAMCGGLPLALTTIARAMAQNPGDCKNIIARLDKAPDDDNDTKRIQRPHQILEICYDALPGDSTKECFLSCALWPEGCPIEKLELIHSWMGLGLLDKSINCDFDTAYNEGNSVIENLVAACLLEPDLTSKNKIKMHGVIRDMALWIANEKEAAMKKWIVKEDSGPVVVLDDPKRWEVAQRRISLMSLGLTQLPELPQTLDCPRLSSLMLQKNPGLTKIPDFFQFMVALSFLDLSFTGLWELPEVIGSLTQLHYLNLSNTPISSLPSSLKNLKGLKYLLLNNTGNLRVIQHGLISSLSMLLVLDLFGCGYADWELGDHCRNASIGEFNKLEQGLKFLGITIETLEALVQLSKIPGLSTQQLGIVGWVDKNYHEKLMDLLSRPSIYQDLKVLKVEKCGGSKVLTIGDDNESWCLPKLHALELRNLINLTKIIWKPVNARKYLPMIRELIISDCATLKDVSWVLDLPYLECLELSNCECMGKVVSDDRGIELGDARPFCGLKTLVLKKLSCLRSFCDRAYDFPALEYMEVQECKMLQELPFSSKIIENKSLVIHGEDTWWNNLKWNGEAGNIKPKLRFSKF